MRLGEFVEIRAVSVSYCRSEATSVASHGKGTPPSYQNIQNISLPLLRHDISDMFLYGKVVQVEVFMTKKVF